MVKKLDIWGSLKWLIAHLDLIILLVAAFLIWQNYGLDNERMINIVLLVLGAFLFEKYYVERMTVLPNVLVVYFIFRSAQQLPEVLNYYLLGGLLIGVIALYLYVQKTKMPNGVYGITYPLYGLKTVLPFYFTYLLAGLSFDLNWWLIFLVLLAAIWVFGVKRVGNRSPLDLSN